MTVNEPQAEQRRQIPVRLIAAAIAAVLLVILIVQNSQEVTFEVLFWEVEARLIWMLLLIGMLGFLAGLMLPRFRR